ncbi:MAG: hypothetical protein C4555_06000 [Dehalococcoidia bacterium]|nr:MAG: hypothetical protein C4555_06000 [Dehalococcoidia bacterium]
MPIKMKHKTKTYFVYIYTTAKSMRLDLSSHYYENIGKGYRLFTSINASSFDSAIDRLSHLFNTTFSFENPVTNSTYFLLHLKTQKPNHNLIRPTNLKILHWSKITKKMLQSSTVLSRIEARSYEQAINWFISEFDTTREIKQYLLHLDIYKQLAIENHQNKILELSGLKYVCNPKIITRNNRNVLISIGGHFIKIGNEEQIYRPVEDPFSIY